MRSGAEVVQKGFKDQTGAWIADLLHKINEIVAKGPTGNWEIVEPVQDHQAINILDL